MVRKVPVILDVDTGIDDAMAIALASRSESCELVAVTTVAGNTTIDHATRNSLDVLDLMGRADVPVHRGASRPLSRPLQQAAHVHGNNGIGGALLPESGRDIGADRGPAAMIRLVKERPGEITLVCVGPLTNLAIALNVEPSFPEYLRSLVIMGGAYFVPGNVTPAAEFNFYCDPEAADQVLRTPFPDVIAIGLDVTHQVALPRSLWESVRDQAAPAAQLVSVAMESLFSTTDRSGFYIHDALALGVALDPSLVRTELRSVSVLAGADDRGASRPAPLAPVAVARQVDAQRFLDGFCKKLDLPLVDHMAGVAAAV